MDGTRHDIRDPCHGSMINVESRKFEEATYAESEEMEKQIKEESAVTQRKVGEMTCSGCLQLYGDDHIPKNLKCGHVLCTHCVNLHKNCPECFEGTSLQGSLRFVTNFQLLRFVRHNEIGDVVVRVPKVPVGELDSNKGVWKCNAHQNPLTFLCGTCSQWACSVCLILDHPFHPRGPCKVLNISDARTKVRTKCAEMCKQIIDNIERTKSGEESGLSIHAFCIKICPREKRSHIRLINEIEGHQWENFFVESDQLTEDLKTAHAEIETIACPEKLHESCVSLSNKQILSDEIITRIKERTSPIMGSILEHFTMDLKTLAEGKEPIYVVCNNERGPSWAEMGIREQDRLVVYSLKNGEPPTGGLQVPFDYAKRLIPDTNPTIFFEVSSENKVMGRVFVRLSDSSALSRQIVLMCSGEKGVSYRDSTFYKNENGILYGGDYENNDGTGGRPIIPMSDVKFPPPPCKFVSGEMAADRFSTNFTISTGTWPHSNYSVIGHVFFGLDILKKAAETDTAKIRDCGFVIPMHGGAY